MDTPTASSTAQTTPTSPPKELPHLPILEHLSLDPSSPSPNDHGRVSPRQDGNHTPTFEPAPSFNRTTSTYTRRIGDFPPEIIALIVHHLWYTLVPLPQSFPDPDPYLELRPPPYPGGAPRFAESPNYQAKETLSALALVGKTWGAEATRALWRKVSFGTPRSFESILRTAEEYSGRVQYERPLYARLNSAQIETSLGLNFKQEGSGLGWEMQPPVPAVGNSGIEGVLGERMSISPNEDERWAMMSGDPRSTNLPTPKALPDLAPADSPLLHTKTLNFSRFRSTGLNRTIYQSLNERFVTTERLLTLLRGFRLGPRNLEFPLVKNTDDAMEDDSFTHTSFDSYDEGTKNKQPSLGRLEAVGFTEYMDSSITVEVLEELLFRGGYLAEYEEPEEPAFMHESDLSDFASSSESDRTDIFPSPATLHGMTLSPVIEPFHYRHLQSSHSRSPVDGRTRSGSISSSIAEEDETMMQDSDNEGGADADSVMSDGGARTPVGVGRRSGRKSAPTLQRRSSGSAFAPRIVTDSSEDDTTTDDDEEDRGRERYGRNRGMPMTPSQRARQRFERSVGPISTLNNRSASVPAPFHYPQPVLRSRSIAPSERSSSVPASVSGRYDHHRHDVPKRMVQVLEGSLEVRPLRGFDLCGCISRVFVAAMGDFVKKYKLGPALLHQLSLNEEQEEDEDDEDDAWTAGGRTPSMRSFRMGFFEDRTLNRTFFPHLRRLGLASSLLPSHLLTAFVLSFPYLTHLDLASTLTSPILLKGLALAGQNGLGGRKMRLKGLSLARCRLVTGPAILGLFCGDCPPLTTMAGISDDDHESWGAGEVVSELTDLSLFGDGTYPSPLERPELRLILTVSPAFTSGRLRTVDLSSTPMNDQLLTEMMPPQPHLIELGLASCRQLTMAAVASFLSTKAQSVEVLDLSNSCPSNAGQTISSRRRTAIGQPTISVMELHTILLSTCASVLPASSNPEEAQFLLALRATNLRVVELDEKSLELVQGGAGDWKPIRGKGRRGWYVDTATISRLSSDPAYPRPRELIHLPSNHPRRQALQRLTSQRGLVTSEVGWHARKMEVLRGDGLIGREDGLFAFHAFG
ncbi:uncharacterized protein JCM6883_003472 [Sporobolomyces salmoneus]|uniref:uncharacterized protein n=1 Tax=Sporobolomyces salmoneus TaxID=183962 RepID=UPI0031813517